MLALWKKSYDQTRQHIKKQRHYFANKCPSYQSYGFSCNYVWMCVCQSLSCVWLFWDCSPPGSSVHGIFQGRTLSGLPFPPPGVWMWKLEYKESWVPKSCYFWTMVLEKTLKSPLDCKKIKSVNPKGNQSWIFTGSTDAEAETPILWPPNVKNWLTGKDLDAGKDWRQEEKGTTEDEMVGCPTRWTWVWASSGSWW